MRRQFCACQTKCASQICCKISSDPCLDACLSGGQKIFLPFKLASGNSSDEPDLANINAIIPQLDVGCYCPYIAGIVVQNTTFTGLYDDNPIRFIGNPQKKEILVEMRSAEFKGCNYRYVVESGEWLDVQSGDTLSPAAGAAVGSAVTAAVGAVLATAVGASVGASIAATMAGASAAGGAAGGALLPMIAQVQFLSMSGQIGGGGQLPAAIASLSGGNSGGGKKSSRRRRATRRSRTNSTGAKPKTQEALCSKINSSDSNLATTWASIVLALGTAMFTRLSLRTHELWSKRADIMEGGSISFSEWFGTSWCATIDPLAGAGSFFLSYEMPVLEKGFLGLTDSSAQAWVSGCVQYQVGGAITFFFVFFATVGTAYWMYTSQKKHLTYNKNPHHQDWFARLFGRPPINLDPMTVQSSVPVIGAGLVSLEHFSAAGYEAPSDTKPQPGVCESNRGVGVTFSQPLAIQTIAFGCAFGMEPSGEAYGNMARDYDEEAQPAKRAKTSFVSGVMVHAHNLGGKGEEKQQEEEKKGFVDQEKKSMPSCMSILTGGQKFRGEWKVNPGDDSKKYWAVTEALYKENHGGCAWYKFWMMLVLALTAIFIKCISDPGGNAIAILVLKVADFVVKGYFAPHNDKEAYLQDMWAAISNLVQTAGITSHVLKPVDGNWMSMLFVGTTVAGLAPLIFGALGDALASVKKTWALFQLAKETAESTTQSPIGGQARQPTDFQEAANSQQDATGEKDALPPGWKASKDQNGNVYYYNKELKVTQWSRPEELKVVAHSRWD